MRQALGRMAVATQWALRCAHAASAADVSTKMATISLWRALTEEVNRQEALWRRAVRHRYRALLGVLVGAWRGLLAIRHARWGVVLEAEHRFGRRRRARALWEWRDRAVPAAVAAHAAATHASVLRRRRCMRSWQEAAVSLARQRQAIHVAAAQLGRHLSQRVMHGWCAYVVLRQRRTVYKAERLRQARRALSVALRARIFRTWWAWHCARMAHHAVLAARTAAFHGRRQLRALCLVSRARAAADAEEPHAHLLHWGAHALVHIPASLSDRDGSETRTRPHPRAQMQDHTVHARLDLQALRRADAVASSRRLASGWTRWCHARVRWRGDLAAASRAQDVREHALRRCCWRALVRYHVRKQRKAALLRDAYESHRRRLQQMGAAQWLAVGLSCVATPQDRRGRLWPWCLPPACRVTLTEAARHPRLPSSRQASRGQGGGCNEPRGGERGGRLATSGAVCEALEGADRPEAAGCGEPAHGGRRRPLPAPVPVVRAP